MMSPLGSGKSPQIELDIGPTDIADVGEECSVTEACSVPDTIPGLKPKTNYPQFGSSSIRGVGFTWNAAFDMPQPTEGTQNMRRYDLSSLLDPGSQEIITEQKPLEAVITADYLQESFEHKGQLPEFVNEEVCLESWEPKHGMLEEALLSLKPWIVLSPRCKSRLSLTLLNWYARLIRKPAAKDHSRIVWTCVSIYSTAC